VIFDDKLHFPCGTSVPLGAPICGWIPPQLLLLSHFVVQSLVVSLRFSAFSAPAADHRLRGLKLFLTM
jgi:hypothetical protein